MEVEPQGEEEGRRETRDKQRPWRGGRSRQHLGSDSAAGLLPLHPQQCPRYAVRVRGVPSAQGLHACCTAGTPASICSGTVRDVSHSSVPKTAKRASHSHLLGVCEASPEILTVLGG